jgi:hypothetical protein
MVENFFLLINFSLCSDFYVVYSSFLSNNLLSLLWSFYNISFISIKNILYFYLLTTEGIPIVWVPFDELERDINEACREAYLEGERLLNNPYPHEVGEPVDPIIPGVDPLPGVPN